jgi:hypothetical protein
MTMTEVFFARADDVRQKCRSGGCGILLLDGSSCGHGGEFPNILLISLPIRSSRLIQHPDMRPFTVHQISGSMGPSSEGDEPPDHKGSWQTVGTKWYQSVEADRVALNPDREHCALTMSVDLATARTRADSRRTQGPIASLKQRTVSEARLRLVTGYAVCTDIVL